MIGPSPVDTFAPCGPALVTLDEIDLQALGLRTRINGDVLQEREHRRDVIATGTPAGVGGPKGLFLREADTVAVEVDGLGAVTNRVRSE